MFNPIAIWQSNRKAKGFQDLKDRILRQKGPILDAFSESITGAKLCPQYMGQKCIGGLCHLFRKYNTMPDGNGKVGSYWKCSFNQMPGVQVEMLLQQRITNQLLTNLIDILKEKKKQ